MVLVTVDHVHAQKEGGDTHLLTSETLKRDHVYEHFVSYKVLSPDKILSLSNKDT